MLNYREEISERELELENSLEDDIGDVDEFVVEQTPEKNDEEQKNRISDLKRCSLDDAIGMSPSLLKDYMSN